LNAGLAWQGGRGFLPAIDIAAGAETSYSGRRIQPCKQATWPLNPMRSFNHSSAEVTVSGKLLPIVDGATISGLPAVG
jgi:hypothetical protein